MDISQQGVSGLIKEVVKVHETTFENSFTFIQQLASKHGSGIKSGRATSVRIREYVAGRSVSGKDKHLSFYGLSPEEFKEIIVETLENKK